VSGPDEQTSTTERKQEIQVQRTGPGRYVLRVGDEVRACAERDLPEALRQSLGLGRDDALALAEVLRNDR
jgi:hypothetical protein